MFRIWHYTTPIFSTQPDTERNYITGLVNLEQAIATYKHLVKSFPKDEEKALECGAEQFVDGEWLEYFNDSGHSMEDICFPKTVADQIIQDHWYDIGDPNDGNIAYLKTDIDPDRSTQVPKFISDKH